MDCCGKNGKLQFCGLVPVDLFSNVFLCVFENIPLGTHFINFHFAYICETGWRSSFASDFSSPKR